VQAQDAAAVFATADAEGWVQATSSPGPSRPCHVSWNEWKSHYYWVDIRKA